MHDQMLARLREEALMAQNEDIWQLIADLEALEPDAGSMPPDMSAGLPVMSLELVHDGRSYRYFPRSLPSARRSMPRCRSCDWRAFSHLTKPYVRST